MSIIFDEYLSKKKINANTFREANPERYWRFVAIFEQMHEDSFTAQKLYLLNSIRRLYPLPKQN